jgi:L-aminopeptidase/D-esterase-like protein
VSRIGTLAAKVMADAIIRAATQATSIPGYPAARDLK